MASTNGDEAERISIGKGRGEKGGSGGHINLQPNTKTISLTETWFSSQRAVHQTLCCGTST